MSGLEEEGLGEERVWGAGGEKERVGGGGVGRWEARVSDWGAFRRR